MDQRRIGMGVLENRYLQTSSNTATQTGLKKCFAPSEIGRYFLVFFSYLHRTLALFVHKSINNQIIFSYLFSCVRIRLLGTERRHRQRQRILNESFMTSVAKDALDFRE